MQDYLDHPEKFRELEIEEQLSVIADIVHHYEDLRDQELEKAGKTRTDACLPARRMQTKANYWDSLQKNIRAQAFYESNKIRRVV